MLPVTGPCYCRFLVWQLVHDKLGLRGKTSLVLNRQNRRRCVDLESRIYSPLAGSDGVYTTVPLQVNLARVSGPSARYGFSRGFSCVLVCFFPLSSSSSLSFAALGAFFSRFFPLWGPDQPTLRDIRSFSSGYASARPSRCFSERVATACRAYVEH